MKFPKEAEPVRKYIRDNVGWAFALLAFLLVGCSLPTPKPKLKSCYEYVELEKFDKTKVGRHEAKKACADYIRLTYTTSSQYSSKRYGRGDYSVERRADGFYVVRKDKIDCNKGVENGR